MQKEKIFNVFLIISSKSGAMEEVRATKHIMDGSDSEKIRFLQLNVLKDLQTSKKYKIPEYFYIQLYDGSVINGKLPYQRYREIENSNSKKNMLLIHTMILENFLKKNCKNKKAPLMVISPIVDGKLAAQDTEEMTV